MTTNEMLRRYVDERSEAAFGELVRQHIDLVYSSALRQMNGDAAAAQDITQLVFTELARNAPRLSQHTSLAGWLYTSARYLAAKALRAEQRRRFHEREAHDMNQLLHTNDLDATWRELRPLLDEAMHELSATDREAILLRYFQRLPLAQVGIRLGLKESAAHMRIDRAINRLRVILAKRGVTSTVAALSTVLTGRAVGGTPAGLAFQVSRGALASVAPIGGLSWSLLKLAGLMEGKMLLVACGVALLACLVFLPRMLTKNNKTTSTSHLASAEGNAAAPRSPADSAIAGANEFPSSSQFTESNKLVLHIVANDTGKPIAGATVEFIVAEKGAKTKQLAATKVSADELGVCEIPLIRNAINLLVVRSRIDGFVDSSFSWSPGRGETIPWQYTLRLDRSVPIGGRVVDEDGKPVADAEVSVQVFGNSVPENNLYPPHVSTVSGEQALTDSNGHWQINRFARKDISTLSFKVTHPNYVADLPVIYMNDPEIQQQRLAGTYVSKLDRGLTVSGVVVDSDGQPVAGVKITSNTSGRLRETTNQSDGAFTLADCKAGPAKINAEALGFALTTLNIDLTNNQAPLRLELLRGNLLRLRVVNIRGAPVSNATVSLQSFQNAALEKQTDAEGRINWDSAPDGRRLFEVRAKGYQLLMNVPVTADGEEHQITLHSAWTISGSVRDAATGQPIPAFQIVTGELELPGIADGTNVSWEASQTFRDGTFHVVDDDPGASAKFKFEADGCAPFVTRVLGPDEGEVSFDVRLYPAAATTITILSPNGQPATDVPIALEMTGATLRLIPGGFDPTPPGNYNNIFSANAVGRFELQSDDTVTRVIAANSDGYAETTPTALATKPTMRLQPWGRIEGTILSDGQRAAGWALTLEWSERQTSELCRFDAETDAGGNFKFPKVPPGRFVLFRTKYNGTRTPIQDSAVTVHLGETTVLSLTLYTETAHPP